MARLYRLVLPILPLTACATGGDYPSLAPRPVEQLSMEEPVRVDPPVAPDPALRGRAAQLLADARRGDGQFDAAYARALPIVRGAGPSGSDSWVQAQEQISRVEAARVGTSSALTALDELLAEQADDPTNEQDHAQLVAARAAAAALVAEQERRVDGLKGSVSRR